MHNEFLHELVKVLLFLSRVFVEMDESESFLFLFKIYLFPNSSPCRFLVQTDFQHVQWFHTKESKKQMTSH